MKVVKIMKTLYLLSYTQRKRKESDTLRIMRDIIILIIPAIIEYSFQALVNYADFIMVGKLGMKASATIGITNEVTFLVKASVNALSVGVVAYFKKKSVLEEETNCKTQPSRHICWHLSLVFSLQ